MMPWRSPEQRNKWKENNKNYVLKSKARYNRIHGLYLTDNYLRKRIRDRYGIIDPSRKLIFFKRVQMLFYRELENPRDSNAYKKWVTRLNKLVEEEEGIRNWNRKRMFD